MLLPKNEKRNLSKVSKKKIWIYGEPFSGKTYLANQFEDVLMLNTDGNVNLIDAPYVAIKNNVVTEGRITNTTKAWEVFKDVITELEKKDNTFKSICLDLVEDVYEHCRVYVYDKLDITHESEAGYGKGYDIVKTEFLSTMKRFFNLDYENIIIISHEDTSKEITKRNSEKFTAIKPNIPEKVALKLAGMVDVVVRATKNIDEYRLEFKSSESVFGGGRLNIKIDNIPNDYRELMKIYDGVNEGKSEPDVVTAVTPEPKPELKYETVEDEPTPSVEPVTPEPKRVRRVRKVREV